MTALAIENVSVFYPVAGKPPVHALQNINLEIHEKDFLVALGASGCGKSTLLNLIAGFMAPSEGEISLNGRVVSGPGADRSVVFQKHALLPWLNVLDNVAFGLVEQRLPRAQARQQASAMLARFGRPLTDIAGIGRKGQSHCRGQAVQRQPCWQSRKVPAR